MKTYEYLPLRIPSQEVRFLELMPGTLSDEVRVVIHHSAVSAQETQSDGRLSLSELRKTLPETWDVYETLDGRYLFRHVEEAGWINTWDHPDPEFDCSKYELPEDCVHSKPSYEALSYVWGTQDNGNCIIVESTSQWDEKFDNQPERTKIPVKANLMAALRYLRQPDVSRMLWVDAVCINQRDNAEKSTQVQRMAGIYKSAHRVIVWFGLETNDSKLAMSTLQYLSLQFEGTVDNRRLCSPAFTEIGWFYREHQLPYNEETWDAIHHLLLNPWFTRLWVVQEFVLANRMSIAQCGADTILLAELRRAILCLSGNLKLPSPSLSKLLIECMNLLGTRLGNTFDDVLMNTRHRGCSEPKDRIYGLLGMITPQFASKLRPCYDDTLSTGQLYRDAFLLYSKDIERLDLFKHCDVVDRIISEPSWVPDWSARRPYGANIVPQFSAGFSRAFFSFEAPKTLRVLGVRCAVVNEISEHLPKDFRAICKYIDHRLRGIESPMYKTGDRFKDAFALALTGGRVAERWPTFGFPSLIDWVEEVQVTSDAGSKIKYPRSVESTLFSCQWRRIIETEEGYVGLAPNDTRRGDEIVVLLGCPSPLVLRPHDDGSFEVVGECFIHGLNDAIGFLGPLPRPWKVIGGWGHGNRYLFTFLNTETKESTHDDPRLSPLTGSDWERFSHEPDANDPEIYDFFKHKGTGEIMNSDPRMLPESLETKGIRLISFSLI